MAKKEQATFIVSGKGLIISLAVVVFTAVWMFVLGIWVGRETSPIRFQIRTVQEELAEIDNAKSPEDPPLEVDGDVGEKKAALDFYEDLKSEKTPLPVVIAKPAESSSPPANGPKVKRRRVPPKPKEKVAIQPAKAVAETPKPLPEKEKTKPEPPKPEKAEPKPPNPKASPYTIQVASLKEAAAADRMIGKLKENGIDAFRVKIEIPGKGTWYRVRVGHFKDSALASHMIGRLKSLKYQPMVVKK